MKKKSQKLHDEEIKEVLKQRKHRHDKYSEVNIPQGMINDFAKMLLPHIKEYIDSADGKRDFEQWLNAQDK